MKRLEFSIEIKASAPLIYKALTNPELFAQWSVVFDPNSHLEGSWKKDTLVRFLTYDSKGQLCGLLSRVRENTPYKKIHIDHVGMLEGNKEIFDGPQLESVKGGSEIYRLETQGELTHLTVESDAIMDLETYLNKTWPVALKKLKDLCENSKA